MTRKLSKEEFVKWCEVQAGHIQAIKADIISAAQPCICHDTAVGHDPVVDNLLIKHKEAKISLFRTELALSEYVRSRIVSN